MNNIVIFLGSVLAGFVVISSVNYLQECRDQKVADDCIQRAVRVTEANGWTNGFPNQSTPTSKK